MPLKARLLAVLHGPLVRTPSHHHTNLAMTIKSSQPAPAAAPKPLLDRQVRVSESGQFAVSMDAVRALPSFSPDVKNVAQIRQKLQSKR